MGGAYRALPFGLLLGGAYRALLIFGVMLLAGRIAPVISVVVFIGWSVSRPFVCGCGVSGGCFGGLISFCRLVARGVCFFF